MYNILELHNDKTAAALVGADPGQPGGPWAFREGRAPGVDDEVAVDAMLADTACASAARCPSSAGHCASSG